MKIYYAELRTGGFEWRRDPKDLMKFQASVSEYVSEHEWGPIHQTTVNPAEYVHRTLLHGGDAADVWVTDTLDDALWSGAIDAPDYVLGGRFCHGTAMDAPPCPSTTKDTTMTPILHTAIEAAFAAFADAVTEKVKASVLEHIDARINATLEDTQGERIEQLVRDTVAENMITSDRVIELIRSEMEENLDDWVGDHVSGRTITGLVDFDDGSFRGAVNDVICDLTFTVSVQ